MRSVENETKQKTRQQNKTQGSKQGKQIINQNIRVLTPLGVFVEYGLCVFCRLKRSGTSEMFVVAALLHIQKMAPVANLTKETEPCSKEWVLQEEMEPKSYI